MDVPKQHLKMETGDDRIAVLTINRPDKLNALNSEVLNELNEVFVELKRNKNVHGVIITGAGDKAFAAGADISELSGLDSESGKKTSLKGQGVFDKIESFPKPVLALVNGFALGGGAELAMACHLRVATENAVFGLPEVSLGLIPGYGGTQRLPELVGRGKAMEMILTGDRISAKEAEKSGLVNKMVTKENAVEEARKLLMSILKNSPKAINKAIKAINSAGTSDGYKKEAELFGELCETDDFKEGISAFLEKKKPDFTGN